jgi:hypothetical protein
MHPGLHSISVSRSICSTPLLFKKIKIKNKQTKENQEKAVAVPIPACAKFPWLMYN